MPSIFRRMASGALTPLFVVRQRQGALEAAKVLAQGLVLLGGAVFWAAGVAGPFFGLLVASRALLNVASVRLLAIRRLGYRPRAGLRDRGLGAFLRVAVDRFAAADLLCWGVGNTKYWYRSAFVEDLDDGTEVFLVYSTDERGELHPCG